ncbi:MAG: peptidylprolyl isomerase [Pseudomonadota bacterium]|jgi:peptidyl-prolyl cis-trans isomerase C|uniref:peptidylprolyl isomerase n=1 Tax=Tritonibacter mobilis TaxID=379347 RepID=UPI0001B8AC80|nr:PpiC-type peptidyl-prolyl cis-trans isomerase [Ruegeria sp. TrichCH4B]MCZ4267582.1 peptidylprolyl isomerase [Rhodobacteraceae bacterium G21628-S1]MEE2809832.1 peptidylprolyl isomerase [Pseudomonadota bacterium]NKX28441.1 peptidylprolyl isomerase [Rhodobacteraceae bacterium R_SAG6]PXW79697.1 peptidyl-prolyl cis-trans isomerase C [Ruegeria sp. P4]
MRKGLTFLRSVAFAAAFGLAAPAYAELNANTVVAKVNGEEITVGNMIVARAKLPAQYQSLPDDLLFKALLDQLIQQTVLKQQLHGDTPEYVRLSVEHEERSLLASDVIESVMEDAQTEDAIRDAYDARYSSDDGGDEFNASHILLESEEDAVSIKEQLDAGADFAALAKESSTGPSGPNGGELGWFENGRMVPEFEAAVAEMRPGEVSEPVQTQFGWHIIKLNDRRKLEAPDYEDVREEIGLELAQQAVEDRINQLTASATIDRPEIENLEPSVLRDMSLIEN